MSPEYGANCGMFTVDEETLRYLRMTGRSEEQIGLVEAYCKEQGLFHTRQSAEPVYSQVVELDLATVEPSIAGPKRPQDRVPLSQARKSFHDALPSLRKPGSSNNGVRRLESEGGRGTARGSEDGRNGHKSSVAEMEERSSDSLSHGSVVIAAITSCTNTSNPS